MFNFQWSFRALIPGHQKPPPTMPASPLMAHRPATCPADGPPTTLRASAQGLNTLAPQYTDPPRLAPDGQGRRPQELCRTGPPTTPQGRTHTQPTRTGDMRGTGANGADGPKPSIPIQESPPSQRRGRASGQSVAAEAEKPRSKGGLEAPNAIPRGV